MDDVQHLETDLWAGIEECKRLGYNPTRFIRMVKQYGAVEPTRMVVDTRVQPTVSSNWRGTSCLAVPT